MSRLGKALGLALWAALALAALAPAAASAAFGIAEADLYFEEEDGSAAKVAGSHPFAASATVNFKGALDEKGKEVPDEAVRDVVTELPLGFAGIPEAAPQCSGADFAEIDITSVPQLPNCPDDSAVGYVNVHTSFLPVPPGEVGNGGAPLYNLKPAPGAVAKFGFVVASVPITFEARLSETAPYRVVATIANANQAVLIYGATITLWGNPASPAHDTIRGSCLKGIANDGSFESNGSCPVGPETPEVALLTLPRACLGPLEANYSARSWEAPGVFSTASSLTHEQGGEPAGFEGCGELDFNAQIGAQPSTHSAESPSGLRFDLEFPENPGISDPTKRANSDLKRIVARLPEGVTLNPSAADGLQGCTTAQLEAERLGSAPGEGCPQAAKVGTVTATSPLVDEALSGQIFVAQPDDPVTPAPGQENPFDSFLAIYLVLRNQNLGVIVKQAGEVRADPASGRLTAIFDDAPQVPIEKIETRFREGPRAPLVTPGSCGTFVAEAEQTPWAAPAEPLTTTAEFQIASGPGGGPCPGPAGPFAPAFSAGTADNAAGAYSPFNLRLTRQDGEAELTRFSLALPPGLTGKLAGLARCPEEAIAAARAKTGTQELASPSCPAASQVGGVLGGAGVGPALTWVAGKAYLAGPHNGAPFSVVVITPALAGPFDAGNVVVREALVVDPNTAEVSIDGAASEPIPRILKGIPLRLRELRVSADRPDFTLNPTSCEPSSVRASATGAGPLLGSAAQMIAQLAARFQAADCGRLEFAPKLTLSLKGATKRADHPRLRAEVKARPGDANIGRATVLLPPSQFIDNARINNPCTRVQFAEGACPKGSVLGRARAFTPLLDQPLEGPVYFRSNGGERELPDIVADLGGEVHFVLVGFIDALERKGAGVSRIRNRFQSVPDVPVSKFVISLKGGDQGLLQNSRNLCASPQRATVKLLAHNAKSKSLRPLIKTSCRKRR